MRRYSITKALNLPEYKITEMISDTETQIHIRVEPYKRKPVICSGCGCIHNGPPRGVTEVVAEDRRLIDKRVYLHVIKRRRLCPKDGQIHVEAVDWLKAAFKSNQ